MQKSILLIALLLSNMSFGQSKIYELNSKTEKADINYKAFKQFDGFKIYENEGLKKAFEPKKGKSDIYFLISEYEGDSFDGTRKLFHDYLILKVDPKTQLITDGFQYTLEWAEPPAISDLYQVTAKRVKLSNELELGTLKMELIESPYRMDWKIKLNDGGVIKIK